MSKRRGRVGTGVARARPRRLLSSENWGMCLYSRRPPLYVRCRLEGKFKVRRARLLSLPFVVRLLSRRTAYAPPFAWIAASASLRTSDVMLHISVAVKVVPLPFYRRTEKGKAKLRLLSVAAASGAAAAVTASNRGWTESVLSALLLLPSESQ